MEKWNDFLFGTFRKKSVRFRNFSKQSRKKYRLTSSMDSWTWDTRVSCPGRWESLACADPARKGPCRIRIGWQSSRNKLPSDPWTPSRKRRGSSRKKGSERLRWIYGDISAGNISAVNWNVDCISAWQGDLWSRRKIIARFSLPPQLVKNASSSSFSHRNLRGQEKIEAMQWDKWKAFEQKIVSKLLQHEIGKCGC